MNRASRDRRDEKRPGSMDRRGRQMVRVKFNHSKAKRIRDNRRAWRENAVVGGSIR